MKKIFSIFITFSVAVYSIGQSYSFKHLTTAEGLLSDLRLSMTEDRIGRLWIGSDEGMNVFDGATLEYYNQTNGSGLQNNSIELVFCDKKGTLWIKSHAGVQYKMETENKFNRLPEENDDIANTLFFGQTAEGDLLCVTKNGIYQINKQFKAAKLSGLSALIKKYGPPTAFEFFQHNEWFIGFEQQLFLIDLVKQKSIAAYNYPHAESICKINPTTFFIGSFVKDSVAILNIQSGQIGYLNDWKSYAEIDKIGYACGIAPIEAHKFAIGTRYNGMFIVDVASKSINHLTHDPSDPTTIKGRFCRSLFVSKSGILFVHTQGISYASIKPKPINFQRYLTNQNGEKYDNAFNDFVEAKDGSIWIATNSYLALWNRQSGISTYYPFYDPLSHAKNFRTIRSVVLDSSGRVWVGSYGNGVGLLQSDGSYQQFKAGNSTTSIPSNNVLALVNDNEKNIFVCTLMGFALLNPPKKTITSFSKHAALYKIAGNTTYYAAADQKNNWWLAQQGGLYYYDRIHDSLYNFSSPDATTYQSLAIAPNGYVYTGTENGLYFIQPGSEKLNPLLNKKDGLQSSAIKGLLFDQQGLLWILGNRGLASYNTATKSLINFTAKEGLEISNHNTNSFYLSPNGEMFLGNSTGFNYFYPEKLKKVKDSLQVFTISVEAQGASFNYPVSDQLKLKYYQNSLLFSFLAVDFNPVPLRYRYKLIGLDTAYTYSGEQKQARYANLGPGKYSFVVEASDNDEDWYPTHQILHIKIYAAFWNSSWFRLIVLLLVFSLIYAAYRYRVSQINKQAQLKTDYEVKLSELEMSALRTQMNPHFIFNSLNTINSFISLNNSEQANIYITKFSRLIRLILDHSRKKKITLAEELHVVELYLQMEQIRFESKFIYVIEVDESVETESTEVPPLIIQPFVENSILHGLLPSKIKGLLKVSVYKKEDKIICTIYDNGIGRKTSAILRQKNNNALKTHTSHGMEITLKRIDLFNKENNCHDEVEITDLENPSGTLVKIVFAYSESY